MWPPIDANVRSRCGTSRYFDPMYRSRGNRCVLATISNEERVCGITLAACHDADGGDYMTPRTATTSLQCFSRSFVGPNHIAVIQRYG